jgi:hypothetical protein
MVQQYYVDQVTDFSERELQSVAEAVETPFCLLGGWAVYCHVNNGFRDEHDRGYIGSRDIDLGLHIDPDWDAEELAESSIAQSLERIRELGYIESRFGFVQDFDRETGERISEEEAGDLSLHEVFQVYIDLIPDTVELDGFEEAFGFRPPAETLLKPVFEDDKFEVLDDYVSWSPPESAIIVKPELLAAMKIRALPDRDKSHKRVKDIADLHALLWYVKDYNEIKADVLEHVSDSDIEQLDAATDQGLYENAADLLQIDSQIIQASINRLIQE